MIWCLETAEKIIKNLQLLPKSSLTFTKKNPDIQRTDENIKYVIIDQVSNLENSKRSGTDPSFKLDFDDLAGLAFFYLAVSPIPLFIDT